MMGFAFFVSFCFQIILDRASKVVQPFYFYFLYAALLEVKSQPREKQLSLKNCNYILIHYDTITLGKAYK